MPQQGTFLTLNPGSDTVEVGTSYLINCTVYNNNVSVAPASISLTVRDPQSGTTTPTLTSIATGVYQVAYAVALKGRHVYTVTTTTPGLVSSGEFTAIAKGVT